MALHNVEVTDSWTLIVGGPMSFFLTMEAPNEPVQYAITNSLPTSDLQGQTLLPSQVLEKQIEVNQALYARSTRASDPALLVYSVSVGQTVMGMDQRVYYGSQAVTTQSFIEANSKNGSQFYSFIEIPSISASGGTHYVGYTTGSTKTVIIKSRNISVDNGDVLIEVYKSSVFSGGTPMVIYNMNLQSSNVADMVMVDAPTVTTQGTLIDQDLIYAAGPASSQGIYIVHGIERVLEKNTKYLMKLTNRSTGGAASAFIKTTFFEGALSNETLAFASG